MHDDTTLAASALAEADWRAAYDKILHRFGEAAPQQAVEPVTHSGLPIKNCYFPHDVADIDPAQIAPPGSYPFTRGNLAAQNQFMNWANQPVIGYGLPEHTRARMDLLAEQGMVGYFGQHFYNLVYDLVSHEGLDPDHPAARGRVGQCGMAVYSVQDMARLLDGLDLRRMNVVHITYYQVIPALAQYIVYGERRGVRRGRTARQHDELVSPVGVRRDERVPARAGPQARGRTDLLLRSAHAAVEHHQLLRLRRRGGGRLGGPGDRPDAGLRDRAGPGMRAGRTGP